MYVTHTIIWVLCMSHICAPLRAEYAIVTKFYGLTLLYPAI